MTTVFYTQVFMPDDFSTSLGSFFGALSCGEEKSANEIGQGNYLEISADDATAINLLNAVTGVARGKYLWSRWEPPYGGGSIRATSFYVNKIEYRIAEDGQKIVRLSGPGKLSRLKALSLGGAYISGTEQYTITGMGSTSLYVSGTPASPDNLYAGSQIVNKSRANSSSFLWLSNVSNTHLHWDLEVGWSGEDPQVGDIIEIRGGPAADDLDQIMAFAPDWNLYHADGLSGTASGSMLASKGESVFDALKLAQEHSIVFDATRNRYTHECFVDQDDTALSYTFWWHRTPLSDVSQLRSHPDQASITSGAHLPIISMSRKTDISQRVTRIYPLGQGGLDITSAQGWVNYDGSRFSVDWTAGTIRHVQGWNESGDIFKRVDFNEIEIVASAKQEVIDGATIQAAQDLFYAAIAWLEHSNTAAMTLSAEVSCGSSVQYPGRWYRAIIEDDNAPIDKWFFCHNIREEFTPMGRRTWMELSDGTMKRPLSDGSFIAGGLRQSQRHKWHSGAAGAITVLPTVGGGTGGAEYFPGPGILIDAGNVISVDAPSLAGSGLVGSGGVLAVQAGAGLRIVADDLQVNPGEGIWLLNGETAVQAGLGLDIAPDNSLEVRVQADSGLEMDPSLGLALGQPDWVSRTSLNSITGNTHTHAVSAGWNQVTAEDGRILVTNPDHGTIAVKRLSVGTDAVPAEDGRIHAGHLYLGYGQSDGLVYTTSNLRLWGQGNIQMTSFNGPINLDASDGNINFADALTFTGPDKRVRTLADDLWLEAADDIFVQASGAGDQGLMQFVDTGIQADGFAGGFLGNGWRILPDGTAEFRKITADELHVTLFTAEIAVATGRSLYVTPGQSKLTADFKIPSSIGGTRLISVEDIPGAPGFAVFESNSWVMMRYFNWNTSTGHLQLFLIWGQVSGFQNISNSSKQTYTFTLRYADSSARNQTIERGAPVIGFGKSGAGWVEISSGDYEADDTQDSQASGEELGGGTPAITIRTWSGSNPYIGANRQTRAIFGSLFDLTGNYNEFGLYAGDGMGYQDKRIIASNREIKINNMPISMNAADQEMIRIEPVMPSIALGIGIDGISMHPWAGVTGFFVGRHYDQIMMRIGGVPQSGGKPGMIWDGTNLLLHNSNGQETIKFDSAGNAYIENRLRMGTDGEILVTNTIIDGEGVWFYPQTTSSMWWPDFGSVSAKTAGLHWAGAEGDISGAVYMNTQVPQGDGTLYLTNLGHTLGPSNHRIRVFVRDETSTATAEMRTSIIRGVAGNSIIEFFINGVRKCYIDSTGFHNG